MEALVIRDVLFAELVSIAAPLQLKTRKAIRFATLRVLKLFSGPSELAPDATVSNFSSQAKSESYTF
jgi:hypothetical protein